MDRLIGIKGDCGAIATERENRALVRYDTPYVAVRSLVSQLIPVPIHGMNHPMMGGIVQNSKCEIDVDRLFEIRASDRLFG